MTYSHHLPPIPEGRPASPSTPQRSRSNSPQDRKAARQLRVSILRPAQVHEKVCKFIRAKAFHHIAKLMGTLRDFDLYASCAGKLLSGNYDGIPVPDELRGALARGLSKTCQDWTVTDVQAFEKAGVLNATVDSLNLRDIGMELSAHNGKDEVFKTLLGSRDRKKTLSHAVESNMAGVVRAIISEKTLHSSDFSKDEQAALLSQSKDTPDTHHRLLQLFSS